MRSLNKEEWEKYLKECYGPFLISFKHKLRLAIRDIAGRIYCKTNWKWSQSLFSKCLVTGSVNNIIKEET